MNIRTKILYIYQTLFCAFLSLFVACDDLEDKSTSTTIDGNITETGTAEIYILSEGLFNLNNSSLAKYSFKSNKLVKNYFKDLNKRGLGDTANDIVLYGSKLYIVVNVSSTIEVIDFQTGISIKQIPMFTDNGSSRQPRHIAFYENKAYVCSFDGTVARIDTTSLQIESFTKAGRNPENICVKNKKLYVSNSGGLDYSEGLGVDNTVSVIDIESFTEIKKIEVGPNPGCISPGPDEAVYVATYGSNIADGDFNFVKINSQTDEVERIYNEKVMNFAIDNNNIAYLYNYNYNTEASSIKVLNLRTGETIRENFITDGTKISTPYSINVNPYSGNVYITEAYSYTITGDVLCFNTNGQLLFRLNRIGLNPNSVIFSQKASTGDSDGEESDPNAPSAFANKVLDYNPAPSQYMNTVTTAYKENYTAEEVRKYAEEQLKDTDLCLISLGAYGGYITVGFDHTVPNVPGEYDLKIYGNAYYDMFGTLTGALGGSAEPGIVLVSKDTNGNGLADDEWYELAGSEYTKETTLKNYQITYYRPDEYHEPVEAPEDEQSWNTDAEYIAWQDNRNTQGFMPKNIYHRQDYYPKWLEEDELSFKGTLLPNNAKDESGEGKYWVLYAYPWGYADNGLNVDETSNFNIEWAVDTEGNPVHLPGIDFVKIYTGVNQYCGWLGETSTEVMGINDLHLLNN